MTVSLKTISNTPASISTFLEETIKQSVSSSVLIRLFPRCVIEITVQEVHNNGSLEVAAVNAVCCALLDAGIPMQSSFAAVQCAIGSQDNQIIVNPSISVEKSARVNAIFVFESRTSGLITCRSSGNMTDEEFQKCLQNSRKAAAKMFDFYRTLMERKYSRDGDFKTKPTFTVTK